jgi:hypothetical protein
VVFRLAKALKGDLTHRDPNTCPVNSMSKDDNDSFSKSILMSLADSDMHTQRTTYIETNGEHLGEGTKLNTLEHIHEGGNSLGSRKLNLGAVKKKKKKRNNE